MIKTDKDYREHFAILRGLRRAIAVNDGTGCSYYKLTDKTPDLVVELLEAVVKGKVSKISEIINTNSDLILMQDRFGNTAMSLAMELGKQGIVNLLKQKLKLSMGGRCYA